MNTASPFISSVQYRTVSCSTNVQNAIAVNMYMTIRN